MSGNESSVLEAIVGVIILAVLAPALDPLVPWNLTLWVMIFIVALAIAAIVAAASAISSWA